MCVLPKASPTNSHLKYTYISITRCSQSIYAASILSYGVLYMELNLFHQIDGI